MKIGNGQHAVGNSKKPKLFGIALGPLLLAFCVSVHAQQAKKMARVGVLVSGSPASHKYITDAIRQGLRENGYVEGDNLVMELRYADGKVDRFPALAAELVRWQPDVIVVGGNPVARAAKQATSTIPIVVGSGGDLVGGGLVASLAKPGGNLTGSTSIAPDLSGKRLELLKEVVPKASRIAVLVHFDSAGDWEEVKQTELTAKALGLRLQPVKVKTPKEFPSDYAQMIKSDIHALVIILGFFTNTHRRQLLELAASNHLPSMCEQSEWTNDGCLMSYGPDVLYLYRRAGYFVDRILKGSKPADLPVEQPKKFEFAINLKTAKQVGVTIPQSVLYRANRVIR